MFYLKSLLLLIVVSSVSFAQVQISGTVIDTAGLPVTDALVQLEKSGINTRTGTDGKFTLSNTTNTKKYSLMQASENTAMIRNNNIVIKLATQQKVHLEVFDLQGRSISSLEKLLISGEHIMNMPKRSTALFICKLTIGNSSTIFKNFTSNKTATVLAAGIGTYATNPSLAKRTGVFADILSVKKDTYANYRMILSTSDTSGMRLRVISGAGSLTDADGNVYQTLRYGDYEWTIENLRTTKYNDGTPIPLDTSAIAWKTATSAKYCFYNNTANADTIKQYGALYNFFAVKTGKLAPVGWHVPVIAEWDSLITYLEVSGLATPSRGKSIAAMTSWIDTSKAGNTIGNNLSTNNFSGFNLQPAGGRDYRDGSFDGAGAAGEYWSSSAGTAHGYDPALNGAAVAMQDMTALYISGGQYDSAGMSVRLVRKYIAISAPVIDTQPPAKMMVKLGDTLKVSVVASGNPTPVYQWKKNGSVIEGAIFSTFSIKAVTIADSGSYTVNVSNSQDTITSTTCVVAVSENGIMQDNDGITYNTVKIGTQVWMAENLRSTKYNDGTSITLDTATANWSNTLKTEPIFCYYNNTTNADSIKKFGALYNWYAVNTGKLAPSGWHVPTIAEWDTLQVYLIANGYNYDATTTDNKIAKALASTTTWVTSATDGAIGNDLSKNNMSSFSAVACGLRRSAGGYFTQRGSYGYWWTTDQTTNTMARYKYLSYNNATLLFDGDDKRTGLSVRLVKNK